MLVCAHCAHQNLEGSLFCDICGESLAPNITSTATKRLDSASGDLIAKATWGTARFGEDATITLRVRDSSDTIVLQPNRQTFLGRIDAGNTRQPDIDLTPYGGVDKGVSRLHAVISRSEDTLTLVDLRSANGTHLNGQRLVPDQPRVLRDGDEIRLGKLVIHVYFR
jgi:pSer/pThr/pTyr-binding forkhead associated (FHA) protein